MTNSAPHISFILPVRDQSRELIPFLLRLYKHLESRSETSEVVVVDDGSKDQTSFVIKKLAHDFPTISLVTNPKSQGLGVAMRQGILQSQGSFIILLRPAFSWRSIEGLIAYLTPSFHGAALEQISPTSSFYPPAIAALSLWKVFDWIFSRFVPGGVSARFSPIVFSREAGSKAVRSLRMTHSGFQFELLYRIKAEGEEVRLISRDRPFLVVGLPLFYFMTVTKELVKLRMRSWSHRQS